ncbi:Maltose/maltodextrin import ATP-binding protein MalK [Devosia equisanguinis]|uniref:Maltose/maltodextrin import ATP-binding protein MalK n=1 Tax=Devosia equisanguinis TaxID=2490941 RepID=A0A3S5D3G9_9HYPH|nr:sn-glycerol-3-phosphate ABC transporter ATP-binding protein UgpC [Devosia equisanguinis]VDS05182.1 Maltose/maltodextrin import ATP-binding protein MalK [Devosia equisanguinis]
MAGLALSNVQKAFGQTQIIHGVDLDIADGEFVVFVGPSGCGKSTLLRMIAGLESVTDGKIAIGSRDVTDVDPSERGVAMVFQSYALYPHMSVRDNIGFGLRMNGVPRLEVDRKVADAAAALHLTDLLDRKPKQLSGGQRQRVAIGRAIVRQPDVFLFDEPLSNLDAELRVQMRLEIARLHAELGATMIYVTHDQVEAMTLADKIVVLRAGRVEQAGTPLSLYDDPANLFVAGFIGSPRMNFLRAAPDVDGTIRLPDHGNVPVPLTLAAAPQPAQKLLLGIRPEHFAPNQDVRLSLKVDLVEHLGGASYAYVGSGSAYPLTIEMRDARDVGRGTVLETSFDSRRAFLFDATTGERVR